jgi:hypothetical protein
LKLYKSDRIRDSYFELTAEELAKFTYDEFNEIKEDGYLYKHIKDSIFFVIDFEYKENDIFIDHKNLIDRIKADNRDKLIKNILNET